MLWLVLSLLVPSAEAAPPPEGFGSPRLLEGQPDFTGCIEDGGACQANFFRFLGHSMLEQGFAMQHHPLLSSPLTNRRSGPVVGGDLATFPFAPPRENLSGKEENTSFSPVFPHVDLAWLFESDGSGQGGVGVAFLPPIPVNGASALSIALSGGHAWGPRDGTRWGVEGTVAFVRAGAPIVATEEQVASRDDFDNPDNLDPEVFDAVCGADVAAGAGGCLDTYTLLNAAVRGGWSGSVGGAWTPYAKLGLTAVTERLDVKYDATSWGIFALQPSAHVGTGWLPGEHLVLALGASAALQQANQHEEDRVGLFTTLEGAAGWSF